MQTTTITTPVLTGKQCLCATCHELFSRDRVFDRHRVGEYESPGTPNSRRCLTPTEMAAKGWMKNGEGFWVMDAATAKDKERARAARAARAAA